MSTISTVSPSIDTTAGSNRPRAQAASAGTGQAAPATSGARADQVQLQGQVNPYEGFSSEARRVQVDAWRKGPNDSIERILRNQGYTPQEIYRRDASGKTLIQRVADANGLKDPNLIRPGGKGLLVPVRGEAAPPQPRQQRPAARPQTRPAEPPKPEVPRVEAPKIEVPKLEIPKIEPPKIEIPKIEPPKIEPPKVEAPRVEAPRVEAPRVETPAVDANLREQESAEVGLLLQGVKDGKFTRPEFQALNATANQYTELRAQYARDGFKPEQVRELSQIQHQYGAMYQRFQADDKVKIRFQGGDRNDPQARFRAEQNEQGGRYYDQFRDQRIDEVAFRALLLEQRAKSSELGVQGQR